MFEAFDQAFFKQQKDQEERIKQEKLDEELARSLQNGGTVNPFPTARPAAPSAFDRMSGMRPPPSSSFSSGSAQNPRRTLPWAPNSASAIKSESRSIVSSVKREEQPNAYDMGSYSNSNNISSFKTEDSSSRTMPGAFVDDSSTASDSDLEIIPREAFHDNGRHVPSRTGSRPGLSGSVYHTPQSMQRPSFSLEAQSAAEVALRRVEQASTQDPLQMAMFGSQNVSNWMQNTLPLPNSSQISLPGSYPHPGIDMANAIGYGRPQAYGAGNHVYGGGIQRSGMYPGYAGGDMQNVGRLPGPSLNNTAGGIFGAGLIGNPIDTDDDEGPFPGLGGDLIPDIFNRPLNARMEEQFNYIMNDPRKTNDEIKALLENIRPDTDLPAEDREGTPDGLVYPLVSLTMKHT